MIEATLSRFPEPLSSLLTKLASENHERVVIIFDALMASIVKSAHSLPIVESYALETSSSFNLYAAYWEAIGKPEIPPEAAEMMRQIPSTEGFFSPDFKQFVDLQYKVRDFHSGTIFNTSRSAEGLYIDLLSKIQIFGPDKIWAVGPLNPVFGPGSRSHSQCLDWLDKQPKNSVLFISFGTTSSLSQEQITELALGLEGSKVRFLWLLKDADRGNIFEDGSERGELPQGFEERVRERGIVEREWAPQLEILEHSATGGFLSHCGWNSCMESMSMGLPIVAWPMHSDQPRNSVLITKALRIGAEVGDWGSRGGLVRSSTVEEAVRRVMASPEGDEMRQRAEKLADLIKQSVKVEMDSFVARITR